jgi:hypothetical protein
MKKMETLDHISKVMSSPSLLNYKNAFGNMVAANASTINAVVDHF